MHQLITWKGQSGQWIAGLTACIGSMTAGQVLSWASPALPKIISGKAGFNLSDTAQSWIAANVFVGNMVSPIPVSYVMDSIGRKNSLLIFDMVMILSWVIIYFSKVAWSLYIARLLAGVWCGLIYTIVPVFIGEVVTPKIRGTLGAMFVTLMYSGALYESLVGYADYRLFTILSGIPPVLLFLALLRIPESPYYYLMKGKKENAKRSILWLRGECIDEDLEKLEEVVLEQMANRGKCLDIFKTSATRRAFFMTQILGVIQRTAGVSFLFSYGTIILPESWITADQSYTVFCLVWIFSSLFTSALMVKFGRKTLLLISSAGSFLTMLGVTTWYYLNEKTNLNTSTTKWLPFLLLTIHSFTSSLGIISVSTILQGEVFAVNIKAKASALFCITASLTSVAVVQAYQPLTHYVGIYANFIICTLSCFAGIVFSLTLMIETRGCTLEEIQDILRNTTRKKTPDAT